MDAYTRGRADAWLDCDGNRVRADTIIKGITDTARIFTGDIRDRDMRDYAFGYMGCLRELAVADPVLREQIILSNRILNEIIKEERVAP